MPGERGLHRDLGGLAVADLAHHDHVRIGTDHGAQPRGEGQARFRVRLDLLDAVNLVLHRVLHGHDRAIRRVERGHARVESGGLAGPCRPGHEDGAVRGTDRVLEAGMVGVVHAEAVELHHDLPCVEDPHHDGFAAHNRQGRHA